MPFADDTDTAVTVGHQAIETITALHYPRAYGRLRVLNTALEPLHTSAGVAELRDRLTATAVQGLPWAIRQHNHASASGYRQSIPRYPVEPLEVHPQPAASIVTTVTSAFPVP